MSTILEIVDGSKFLYSSTKAASITPKAIRVLRELGHTIYTAQGRQVPIEQVQNDATNTTNTTTNTDDDDDSIQDICNDDDDSIQDT